MKSINIEKDDLSNDIDIDLEKENISLKQKKIKSKYEIIKQLKEKNIKIKINLLLFIFIFLFAIVFLIFIHYSLNDNQNTNIIKNNYYLRRNIANKTLNDNLTDLNIINNINSIKTEKKENISIIEDIKNVNEKPIDKIINHDNKEQNDAKKKIGIAFFYKTLYYNGIARFITVTSKYLLKTGKYNIFFFTNKPYFR